MMEIQTPQDMIWVLMCTVLVLFMQAGFCCLESGLVRSKNSINVAIKNLIDFCVAGMLFWAFGFAIMYGDSFASLWGTTGFLFHTTTPYNTTFFLFQLVFCGTTTTIVAGAVAERMRFFGYLIIACLLSGVIYPLVGHWIWSPHGWLKNLGFIDFAGSTVVHSVGGWFALATILHLGPRKGRFGKNVVPIYGHDIPTATLGVFILWFGWFGFNGGSTLSFSADIPSIWVNTALAGIWGGIIALAISWTYLNYLRVEDVINGVLAGLVGITASCNSVSTFDAVVIGAIAGLISFYATRALIKFKIDDVVGAVPVHACAGVWGTIAVALFANPQTWSTNLTRLEQLQIQVLGVGAVFVFVFGVGYVLLWGINKIIPLRVSEHDEDVGLNVAEHSARTDMLDLLSEMEDHWLKGDFSRAVPVEPNTEMGKIAKQYNLVLNRVVLEKEKANKEAQHAKQAQSIAESANTELQETIQELNAFNDITINRELRLIELKQQINTLNRQQNLPEPFDLSEYDSITK